MWIQKTVIEELVQLGEEIESNLAEEVILLFEEDGQKNLEDLIHSIEVNNITQIGRLAHKLKSTCANVGALQASKICREIEESCNKKTNLNILPLKREQLNHVFGESKKELIKIRSQL